MKYSQLSDLRQYAEGLVRRGGEIILKHQGNFKVTKKKDLRDVATTVDLEVEEVILKALQKDFPTHSIFSEEKGAINKSTKYKWVLDPLDGTKAYIRNLYKFSCNICLTEDDTPIVSAVYCPAFDRMYSAGRGIGAVVNGKPTKLSSIKEVNKSYVYFYLPTRNRKVVNYEKSWKSVLKVADLAYRVNAESGVSVALCFLANGGMEAYLNLSNPPYWHDLAPGLLIAKESGAIVNTEDYPVVACNNKNIYNELTKLI